MQTDPAILKFAKMPIACAVPAPTRTCPSQGPSKTLRQNVASRFAETIPSILSQRVAKHPAIWEPRNFTAADFMSAGAETVVPGRNRWPRMTSAHGLTSPGRAEAPDNRHRASIAVAASDYVRPDPAAAYRAKPTELIC